MAVALASLITRFAATRRFRNYVLSFGETSLKIAVHSYYSYYTRLLRLFLVLLHTINRMLSPRYFSLIRN